MFFYASVEKSLSINEYSQVSSYGQWGVCVSVYLVNLRPQVIVSSEDGGSTRAESHVNGSSQSGQVDDGGGREGVGVGQGIRQQETTFCIRVINL